MKASEIINEGDMKTLLDMLGRYRISHLEKWRHGVRSGEESFDKGEALAILVEELVRHEAITASKGDVIRLLSDKSDYGMSVGIGVTAEMSPVEIMTVLVFAKMVVEVLRHDQSVIEHLKKEIQDNDRTLATWTSFFLEQLGLKSAGLLPDDPIVISGAAFREFETWQARQDDMENDL